MCYTAVSQTRSQLNYAAHRNEDPDEIAALEAKLRKLERELLALYHVSGFAHPNLLVFTDAEPLEPKAWKWGLAPFWAKDRKTAEMMMNKTLNARGETIFEKPSFRASANGKRCLIYLDSFFEFHHFKGKTYPFHVTMRNNEPMAIAGLWEEWVDKETGEVLSTVSIVTTLANPLMEKIHNNPKAKEPRMPVILPKELQDDWLCPIEDEIDKQKLQELLVPYDDSEMMAHTVGKIKGKDAIDNIAEAHEEHIYAELEF